ncbi:MAG: Gfo/Idh/MocA family oxidoreductase [Caldilineaceae bacterium]|nr:Gfo/Idh/MocA family oxidoreductase [Caldilineaceae bacterium]
MTDSPLNVALVGPGRMGRIYARLASELSETRLVAVCGRSEASTTEVAGQYGVPGYPQGRHEEMLESHPEIEAVVICPSEWMHTAPVLASLEAGKHVLVEKPMDVSLAGAQAMVDTADRVGTQLMVCHSLRFDIPYANMRAAVAAGEIGEVMHLYSRRNTIQFAAERVLGKISLAYWLTPHDIDMMLWTVGRPITEVKAYSRDRAKGRHDFIIAVYTFDNGVIGVHETSWSSPAFSGRPQGEHFSVHGTRGAAEVLGHENAVAIYRADGEPDYPDPGYSPVLHGRQEGFFRSLFSHFIGVVQGKWEPVVTGRDGLAAIRVADALERALASGNTETVNYGNV